ncbi:MAG TPA: patatin-like phospholipase family protein [Burkholderiales bacterium]|nr:patatin-like phospholipase family protein [Burkholderiales bacterium]
MKTILSIDGGGIRGLIPALVIAQIEQRTGRRAAELFDFFAGTSTGGIIALALNVPDQDGKPLYTAEALADFYRQRGEQIFDRSFMKRIVSGHGWIDELYDHRPLNRILQEYFGGSLPMRAALKPVMVSTYDLHNRKPRFLKSFNPEHYALPMWLAARATSAAPTYFEPADIPIESGRSVLVDGGVFVNNPAASAYAEAVRGWKNEDIFVVSIGTGSETASYDYGAAQTWGKLEWVAPLIHLVFDGVSDAVDYQMNQMLGDRFLRLQITLQYADADLGNASADNLKRLEADAQRLIAAHNPEINRVCALLAARQQPPPPPMPLP